ncbi:MAG: hypothetical protein RBU37_16205 [Myxococcota bacterium]|nr:hypothetical protein [Myxococcota bacterium]
MADRERRDPTDEREQSEELRPTLGLRSDEVEAFLRRGWGRGKQLTARQRLSPEQALALADSLWQQARAQHPAWPSLSERKRDLEAHVQLVQRFQRLAGRWSESGDHHSGENPR